MNEEKNIYEKESTDNSQYPSVENGNTQSVPDLQPETSNQQKEIEKMEVHHLSRQRKKEM